MIPAQEVSDEMRFILDAEDSDRYLFDQDIKPAINASIGWLTSLYNRAFEDNKLSAETLRELIRTRVWVANNFGRIKYDETVVGDKLWSFLGVFPEPDVFPFNSTPPTLANDFTSIFMVDVAFDKSIYSARKLTIEKWNENSLNIFEAGNDTLTNELKSYAYLTEIDYRTDTTYTEGPEIEIRPRANVNGEFVAISYLKQPDEITDIGDDIEFPSALKQLLVQKALSYISMKQGDNTNLAGFTAQEISTLVSLMT